MKKEEIHQYCLTAAGRIFITSLKRKLKEKNVLSQVEACGPTEDLVESYFWWYYSLTEYPKKCLHCGNSVTKFTSFKDGYKHDFCSVKCSTSSSITREKIKHTCVERFGVEHQMLSEKVKKKIRQTCLDRYGVDNALKTEMRSEGIQKKFGVNHISQSRMWKEKTDITFENRYGGRGFSGALEKKASETIALELNLPPDHKLDFHKAAALLNSKRQIQEKLQTFTDFTLTEFDAVKEQLSLQHSCGHIFTGNIQSRNRFRCLKCSPLSVSRFEDEVAKYVENLGFSIVRNDRKLIRPLELDIVIPEKRLAIECNGDYWHSFDRQETKIEREKHLKKLIECEREGYQLVQISEHEWYEKMDIIKSIIAVRLGKAKTLFARKLQIVEITSAAARKFCIENHLQGWATGATVILGAYYNDMLVACMTLGKNRFIRNAGLELIRFAVLKDTIIVGAFAKFMAEVKRRGISGVIESYLDRRIFSGKSLHDAGWKLVRTSQPGYCWLYEGRRLTRGKTQKQRLASILGDKFDATKSEASNMFAAGASRLWDCGQHVFAINI